MSSAHTDLPTRSWASLPEDLKAKLRLGFTGKRHLLDIAGWCLRSADASLAPIAADALETVVRENPLDGAMAGEMVTMESIRAVLSAESLERLKVLARNWHQPDDLESYGRLQVERDFPAMKRFIRSRSREAFGNLFWVEQGVIAGCMDGDHDYVAEILSSDTSDGVKKVIHSAFLCADSIFSSPGGACVEKAVARPWDVNTVLRAYDSLEGVGRRREPLPGSVAVLLYSWNKADELEKTLASLAGSDLADASLFVLDNGSTDSTADILKAWHSRLDERLGGGRFRSVSLPVNVGAAAARNWLLHMEAVRAHDFVCYLDDDVELPADWLIRLGAAVSMYPDAGVWGCKVVDHANPLLIQSADSHLISAPDQVLDLSRVAPHPFRLSDLHLQTLDTGVFDFMRPCASVTGCCHLFRTETLLESGDFAIQLSPSQYDDMEHDLRLCEAGRFPVYQGHLAVRHKKRTGVASRSSMQEEGNAIGNKYKMQAMHEPAGIAAASAAEQRLLDEDILRKLAALELAASG